MAVSTGSVSVDVVPDASGWVNRLRGQIEGDSAALGEQIGRKISEGIAKAIADSVRDGIDDGVRNARPDAAAGRKGRSAGGAFARAFKAEVEKAIQSLPEIEIDANSTQAQRDIAFLRSELISLADKKIGVDISGADALAEIQAIKTLLASIQDQDVDIDFDLDSATRALGQLQAKIADEIGGSFERTLREKLRAATAALPDIDIDANTSRASARLQALRAELQAFSEATDIDLDINSADALAEVQRLRAEYQLFVADTNNELKLRIDAAAAIAQLESIIKAAEQLDDIDVDLDLRDVGAFISKVRAALDAAQAALPDLTIGADSTEAQRTIASIRAEIATLRGQVELGMDVGEVNAKLAALTARLEALRDEHVDIQVDVDAAAALAALAAISAAAAAAGSGGATHFQRWQLILVAVLALFPLIAGAIVALAGAFALIVTPIAAIALGLDGIKAAAAPLVDEFTKLKAAVSDVFESGLGPAINTISAAMPTLQAGIVGAAQALTAMANEVVRVSLSGQNLATISDSFKLINQTIELGAPALASLSENIIRLTNIGAQGMQLFAVQMKAVGDTWRDVIASLETTGVGVKSVEALFSILASLLNLLAPLTELGAIMLASFGPALAGAIDVVTVAIQVLVNVLSLFPSQAQGVVTALALILGSMAVLGKLPASIAASFTAMGAAFVGAGASAGAAAAGVLAFGRALLSLILNPIVLAITGITIALSALSTSQSNAAAAAAAHAAAVSGLASELSRTGGAVTKNVEAYVAQTEAFKTASEGAKLAGVSLGTLTDAATGNKVALEQARAALQKQIEAHTIFPGGVDESSRALLGLDAALDEQGQSMLASLNALNELAATYTDAQQRNRDLAAALRETGSSTVAGVAASTQLSGAVKALGEAMTSTADRATALYTALILLAGGTVPLEVAMSQMKATLREMGDAFTKAKDEAGVLKQGLLDSTGAINTNTAAGAALLDKTVSLGKEMATAAASAFDQAGGMQNAAVASQAAGNAAQAARDGFIQAAQSAGLNAQAASDLADRYGLIPELVVTLLRAESTQAQQELLQIQGMLRGIPPNVPVNIGVVSGDAIAVLQRIGFEVKQIPETGEIIITATDQTKGALDQIVKQVTGRTDAKVPVDLDRTKYAGTLGSIKDAIATTAPALLPTDLEREKSAATLGTIKSEVQGTAPAKIPTDLNTTAVPPAAAAARAEVTSIPAELKIVPGSLEFINVAIANIRTNVATPLNFSLGVHDNATPLISSLKATAVAPVSFPLTAIDVASGTVNAVKAAAAAPAIFTIGAIDNASGTINAIRSAAVAPASMPVGITDQATGPINSIRTLASTTVIMPIDANVSGADAKINATIARVNGTTATMKVDAVAALAEAKLQAFVDKVTGTTSIMKIDANPDLANGKLDALMARINSSTGTVKVNADTAAAEQAISHLARPRSTTLTVNIQTTGQLPNAMGNIVPSGFSFFANGGFSKMSAGRAAIVPPNSPRVIGDRSRDDEAYIPINNSPRSQKLLAITAAMMGRTLIPMASGGIVAGMDKSIASVLRLATALDGKQIRTQTTSSFVGPIDGPSSSGGLGSGSTVEQKLDDVVAAVKSINPGPGSITVEDRSGDPVATGRAVQLALRMAR